MAAAGNEQCAVSFCCTAVAEKCAATEKTITHAASKTNPVPGQKDLLYRCRRGAARTAGAWFYGGQRCMEIPAQRTVAALPAYTTRFARQRRFRTHRRFQHGAGGGVPAANTRRRKDWPHRCYRP